MSPLLTIDAVSKRFAAHHALRDVRLDVGAGEFIALLGPSGCGKTTLLRCIAGFLTPDEGRILIDGEDVTHAPPYRRPLNTVFQSYALFPHMNVLENVGYGPRRQGVAEGRGEAPLAGGARPGRPRRSRQPACRASCPAASSSASRLARAIVNRPKLLLLDEPLSALDLKLRRRMQIELKHIQEKLGIAFIFVTHDQEEAMTMANRIVVMNAGQIEQAGTAAEIYRAPRTRFVAEFVGEANLIACSPATPGRVRLALNGAELNAPAGGTDPARGTLAMVRPEDVAAARRAAGRLRLGAGHHRGCRRHWRHHDGAYARRRHRAEGDPPRPAG